MDLVFYEKNFMNRIVLIFKQKNCEIQRKKMSSETEKKLFTEYK